MRKIPAVSRAIRVQRHTVQPLGEVLRTAAWLVTVTPAVQTVSDVGQMAGGDVDKRASVA